MSLIALQQERQLWKGPLSSNENHLPQVSLTWSGHGETRLRARSVNISYQL